MEWRPKALQHVIQKADAGIDVAVAGAVQVEGDGDLGLAGFAFDSGSAHLYPLRPAQPRGPATATSPASAPRAGEAGRDWLHD